MNQQSLDVISGSVKRFGAAHLLHAAIIDLQDGKATSTAALGKALGQAIQAAMFAAETFEAVDRLNIQEAAYKVLESECAMWRDVSDTLQNIT